jgi:hypothetical protein
MAVATYDTQQGATLTLGTDSLTLRIISITPVVAKIPNIRTTHLGTTSKHTWMPGELEDYDEITVVYQNSPAVAQPTKVVQTITITGPTASGASVPESVTGTGFVNQDTKLPGFSADNEALQTKQMVIKFDGNTGPTRTVSS